MKRDFAVVCIMMVIVLTSTISAVQKVDVCVYTETTQWIGQGAAQKQADILMDRIKGKPGIGKVENLNQKAAAAWMEAHTKKNGHHVFVMYGDVPPSVYPGGNAKKDGSIAEKFLEKGNTFTNSADYFFWGVGGRNKEPGLQNMMDVPGIVQWDDNTVMELTKEGKKVSPTLAKMKAIESDRPFHVDQLDDNWELEVAFASKSGNQKTVRADPCIITEKNYGGRLIQVCQTAGCPEPVGDILADILLNYYVEVVGALAVDTNNKLPLTWANIKTEGE
jgi:hypothetical protein